jgi:hypothetical protein
MRLGMNLIAVGILAALPYPAPACSLCDATLRLQNTYREEMPQAKVILYGTIANPQLNVKGPPGSGTTEFNALRVLKDDPARGSATKFVLGQFLPVFDPKDPPKYIVFCTIKDGQCVPYNGRAVHTDAILKYIADVMQIQSRDRTEQLKFYFQHLDSEDIKISFDAYLEFARCSDEEIGNIAKHLPTAKLRALLQDPKTPTERLGLYAFLLGGSGNDKEAAPLLREMIEKPTNRTSHALDGLLSGYIHMDPKEGWDLASKILGDSKKEFGQRFAVARTLRFFHAWKPAEYKKELLRCLGVMIVDRELADLAINDLREWKMWDLTKLVLAQYGKPTHDSPLARNGIICYALSCPEPEAKQFIAELRKREPDLVRELEESLELEKGKAP